MLSTNDLEGVLVIVNYYYLQLWAYLYHRECVYPKREKILGETVRERLKQHAVELCVFQSAVRSKDMVIRRRDLVGLQCFVPV